MLFYVHSSFAIILMGKRELVAFAYFVFLVYRDCPRGAMGLSAVSDCGISYSYSLTIYNDKIHVLTFLRQK